MDRLNNKVGVLGLGSIGLRHATNLIDFGCDVVGFDPSEDRCALLEKKGGKVVKKKDEILSHADAIVIATPSEYHLSDVALCVENGKHAFVEKPLAHSMDQLQDLQKKIEQKNLVVTVGMNVRLNPAVQHLKDQIEKNEIGRLIWGEYTFHAYLPDWRPHQDHRIGYAANTKTGGIIFDAIHGFDIIHYLLGAYRVKGCLAQSSGMIEIPSDDCADILCQHENGVTSRLHMDYITKPKEHSITIATNKGFATVDISNRHYRFVDTNGNVNEDVSYWDHSNVNDDYSLELKHFLDKAAGKNVDVCELSEAAQVLEQVIVARNLAGLPHA